MNQNEFGNFIKELRKKHNLTQKELADKLHVTYQAVSKWETGKNMPDTLLMKKISEEFNVSIESMFEGIHKKKKDKKKYILILMIIITLLMVVLCILLINQESDFEFKTLTSTCEEFKVSGSISYNDKKSSIYITNIQYCGEQDKRYTEIECVLYESNEDIDKKISVTSYKNEEEITLEDFLKTITLSIDDYQKTCKEFNKDSLFLSINAKDKEGISTNYRISLLLEQPCTK